MGRLTRRSILVVEGKQYNAKELLDSLIYLSSEEVATFFKSIGLTLPRQIRINALREVLELPVAKTIEDRRTLADELSYRLSWFGEYGETQLEGLLSFFNDKAIDKEYLEAFYLELLGYMVGKGVSEEQFTNFFRLARNHVRVEGQKIPDVVSFNKEINELFFDKEGRIDGLTPAKFRPVLYEGATLAELRSVGEKYGVDVPRRIKKNELAEIIIEDLKLRDEYTDELAATIRKMPVIMMQRYAKDNDIKASTELKKEEVIEYILEHAKETKELYFEPSSQSAYEVIVPDEEIPEEDLESSAETVEVLEENTDEKLMYIEIISRPSKLEYKKHEGLELDGLVVMAFYESGDRKTLSKDEFNISEFHSSEPGDVTVTITYQDKMTSFSVKVVDSAPAMLNIEVISRPEKVIYQIGEELDPSGIVVYATYSNGMQKPIDSSDLSFESFDSSKVGVSPVVVRYKEFVSRFEVTIDSEKPVVTGIEIISLPLKTTYLPAEDFSLTGLVVDALYSNGERVELNNKDLKIDGFENGGVGEYDIFISYAGFEDSFKVHVREAGPEVVGIVIDTLPSKLEYYSYEYIDLTGIEVTGILSSGETAPVPVDDLEVFGFDTTAVGKIQITVVYEGHAGYFDIIMKEADLDVEEIVIKSLPHKFSYAPYEALDTEGLEVEAVYQGDRRAVVDPNRLRFQNFDSSVLGPRTITVEYERKSAYFEIQVAGDLNNVPVNEEPEIVSVSPVEEVTRDVPTQTEKIVGTVSVDNSEVIKELREIRKALDDLTKIIVLTSTEKKTKVEEEVEKQVIINQTFTEEEITHRNKRLEKEKKKKDAPTEVKIGKVLLKVLFWVLIVIAIIIVLYFAYIAITTALDSPFATQPFESGDLTGDNTGNPFDNMLNGWKPDGRGIVVHFREFFRGMFGK